MKLNTGCGVIRAIQSVAPCGSHAKSNLDIADPTAEMESYAGLYTFFGGHWCWLYKEKNEERYHALIQGLGITPNSDSLYELETMVKHELYRKEHA